MSKTGLFLSLPRFTDNIKDGTENVKKLETFWKLFNAPKNVDFTCFLHEGNPTEAPSKFLSFFFKILASSLLHQSPVANYFLLTVVFIDISVFYRDHENLEQN